MLRLKHAGALKESFEAYETARKMDKADRFLNTESTKASFRIDDAKRADEIVLLFSKENENSTTANLHDMQCMWYESHAGRSLTRQNQLGLALKKFHMTFKHFADIAEDQFDFHNYCIRKTTLRTYIQMLRSQDRLFSHKAYRRATKDALKIYFCIYDRRMNNESMNGYAEKEMTAAERRKEKHKKKKIAAKEQKEECKISGATGKKKEIDPDPKGEKLLEAEPLEEAIKLVDILVHNSGRWKHTHVLSFECYLRMEKPLLCLRSLLRLLKLRDRNPYDYKLVPLTAQFFVTLLPKVFVKDSEFSELTTQLILEFSGPLVDSKEEFASFDDAKQAAERFFADIERRQRENGPTQMLFETIANLRCLQYAGRNAKEAAQNWLKTPARTMGHVKDFRKALVTFDKLGLGEDFRTEARAIFGRADIFAAREEPHPAA